jgi:predicted GIY-YIG superfamily endonuclease
LLLFRDPRPLDERLGAGFFRELPESPGVYLMRDAADAVLYIGKAKNLRQRLKAYRVANPDRMPQRQLWLLRTVARIELRLCSSEQAALAIESDLLLALRPRFNRAGTWRPPPRFLVWRCIADRLELGVTQTPDPGWRTTGPFRGRAIEIRNALARLLWFILNPEHAVELPVGWIHGRLQNPTSLNFGGRIDEIPHRIEQLFTGGTEGYCQWLRSFRPLNPHPFLNSAIDADLAILTEAKFLPPDSSS